MPRENKIVALQTDDASITTATITIKAIQVGKRQMTQSVFRQLPVSPLVDEENVALIGVPWGHVNYHWGDMNHKARHFIHQRGEFLYRSLVDVRHLSELNWARNTQFGDYFPAPFRALRSVVQGLYLALHYRRIVEGWRPDPERGWSYRAFEVRFFSQRLGMHFDVGDFHPSISCLRQSGYGTESAQKHVLADLAKEAGYHSSGETSAEVLRELDVATAEAADYAERWNRLMDRIGGVEQLFIAC